MSKVSELIGDQLLMAQIIEEKIVSAPWYVGLRWFRKCNDGSVVLISRHYPFCLCWSWSVEFRFIGWQRLWFPLKITGYKFNNGGVWKCFMVLWVLRFTFNRQPYDWIMAQGPDRDLLKAETQGEA